MLLCYIVSFDLAFPCILFHVVVLPKFSQVSFFVLYSMHRLILVLPHIFRQTNRRTLRQDRRWFHLALNSLSLAIAFCSAYFRGRNFREWKNKWFSREINFRDFSFFLFLFCGCFGMLTVKMRILVSNMNIFLFSLHMNYNITHCIKNQNQMLSI